MKKVYSAILVIFISCAIILMSCGTDIDSVAKKTQNADIGGKEGNNVTMIAVNQIGYSTNGPKNAMFIGEGSKFEVIDKESGKTVYTGAIGDYKDDVSSGDKIGIGDFSKLTIPGTYYIIAGGDTRSLEFTIADKPYNDVKKALLKAFYYQRCGMSLDKDYAGEWGHGACHVGDGYLYDEQDEHINVTGGWHDAGDYGKYVVPAAKTVADLMLAYEFSPNAFAESVNTPESNDNVPDVLNEVRYELEWMLKMQDVKSGGVYHKVATLNFPGFIMPEDDKDKRYINAISATATADFAAAMAMVYRIYKPIDISFANKALDAAKKAWIWLQANPNASSFKNPLGVNSGEYGDSNDRDERFWAAAELYSATGEQMYDAYIKANYQDASFSKVSFGWSDVGGYGTISYLGLPKDKRDETVYGYLKSQFISGADKLLGIWQNDGYKVALTPNDYYWGSNGEVMNRSMFLIMANSISPNDDYIEAAYDQLNYILGRNALNQCYITGYGTKPVMHPHHRPSEADGIEAPVPGMLSGGPNSGRQDAVAENKIAEGTPPAKCYIDDVGSYSTNEIAIYWNSPAVFVAAYFDR